MCVCSYIIDCNIIIINVIVAKNHYLDFMEPILCIFPAIVQYV